MRHQMGGESQVQENTTFKKTLTSFFWEGSIYEERLFVCLSHWDFPNHGTSCCILSIIVKPLMNGASNWF
jgi:hypothetical protein